MQRAVSGNFFKPKYRKLKWTNPQFRFSTAGGSSGTGSNLIATLPPIRHITHLRSRELTPGLKIKHNTDYIVFTFMCTDASCCLPLQYIPVKGDETRHHIPHQSKWQHYVFWRQHTSIQSSATQLPGCLSPT